MLYKGFLIDAFEQEPGKWRARVKSPHRRLGEFSTSVDLPSAVEALRWAMEAIDNGYFSRDAERETERFSRKRRAVALPSDLRQNVFAFGEDEIVDLLRAAVEREGSQSAFANRHGINRTIINSILNGKRPITGRLVEALGLRKVYVAKSKPT
jgi:hypothetical protein